MTIARDILWLLDGTRGATMRQLATDLGLTKSTVSKVLGRLKADGLVHISHWVTADAAGGRYYPRPVYRAGKGEDAQRPARKPRARGRHKPVNRAASVFAWAGAR